MEGNTMSSMGSLAPSQSPKQELPMVGDIITIVQNPYGRTVIDLEKNSLFNGQQIIECEVKAIKEVNISLL